MRTVDPARHAAKRAAIRDAAAGVFAELGYTGATTAAICAAAGVGSGTLFHYFGDKRSIMLAIFTDDQAVDAEVVDSLDEAHPVPEVHRLLDHLLRGLDDPAAPGLVVAMMQLAVGDPEFGATLEAGDARNRAAFARLVRVAVADGAVTGVEPERAGRWLVSLVDAAYLMAGDDGFDAVAEAAELHRIVHRYLGTDEAGTG